MRYYTISDTHGFFTETKAALEAAGYFKDDGDKKLVICGDLLDRGNEAKAIQDFALSELEADNLIFVRGNHEDLMVDLADKFDEYIEDRFVSAYHHISNGTVSSALQLTGKHADNAEEYPGHFKKLLQSTPFFTKLLPATVDYFETEHYIFTHGYIPFDENWRNAPPKYWEKARWTNGIHAACGLHIHEPGKTIVCGHWHTSYGHCKYHKNGKEYGETAVYDPFYDEGIIAIDACTAASGKVNCVVLED